MSRFFPVLTEGLLAPHESFDPHFLVYLWPYVLVLALIWIAAPLPFSCRLFYFSKILNSYPRPLFCIAISSFCQTNSILYWPVAFLILRCMFSSQRSSSTFLQQSRLEKRICNR